MNPFTKYLSQWSKDSDFTVFVEQWDRLEQLVIGVHREKMSVGAAEPEYTQVWPWLREQYARWEEALRPYWQATQAAGEQTATDPFRLLLNVNEPAAIIGDRRAMQHLPAAREAINRYLVDHSNAPGH